MTVYANRAASGRHVGPRRRRVFGWLAAALVVALAGCESDSDTPEPTAGSPADPAPATTAVPTSPEPVDPADEALAVYVALWEAYNEAAQDPQADAQEAGLERFAAGDGLAVVTDLVTSLREDELVVEGSIDHSPEVTELTPEGDPSTARVEDCADTSDRSVVRVDGGAYEDEPGGLRLIFADVELHEGMWKVTALGIGRVGSCQR